MPETSALHRAFLPFFLLLLVPGLPSLSATTVEADHVTVTLLSETDAIAPAEGGFLGFHFELEPHWHVYWRNPGASGLPVEIDWDVPPGFEVGEIQWPTPEAIPMGGLVNYGYENKVLLMVPFTAPDDLSPEAAVTIRAEASWLVCKEACIPGSGEFELQLPVRSPPEISKSAAAAEFAKTRKALPQAGPPFPVSARVSGEELRLTLSSDPGAAAPSTAYFFPNEFGLLDPNAVQRLETRADGSLVLAIPMENGVSAESFPRTLDGVLSIIRSNNGENAEREAYTLSLPVSKKEEAPAPALTTDPAIPTADGFEGFLLGRGIGGWLVLAFLGGLVLNVMPCVLPVLSLKVFSLLRHSGQSRGRSIAHGLAYTLGVVVSFIVLAAILLALRAGGEQIGWAFQLQNPGFVVVLSFVFFLFGLNLMGVFEIGTSLVGADSKVAARNDLIGSFGMGILAALVGAPCMGPLIASVSGIAIQETAGTGLLIFAVMGLGLASPFLFLAIFPKLTAFLPKPGAWMESLKQFMGFLLMAALLFLIWVLSDQSGIDAVIALLGALLLAAAGAWVYGRWAAPSRNQRTRWIGRGIALALVTVALFFGVHEARQGYERLSNVADTPATDGWEPWSQTRVAAALADGRPVFVDFTASWCLICQVNKKSVLRTEAAAKLFAEHDVATLEADWTRADPAITQELEKYGRSGVPLYLLFDPGRPEAPQILPQTLSIDILREALEK